jgi:hypothetical protein
MHGRTRARTGLLGQAWALAALIATVVPSLHLALPGHGVTLKQERIAVQQPVPEGHVVGSQRAATPSANDDDVPPRLALAETASERCELLGSLKQTADPRATYAITRSAWPPPPEAEALAHGWPMVIAIFDSTGHLVLLHRIDQSNLGAVARRSTQGRDGGALSTTDQGVRGNRGRWWHAPAVGRERHHRPRGRTAARARWGGGGLDRRLWHGFRSGYAGRERRGSGTRLRLTFGGRSPR